MVIQAFIAWLNPYLLYTIWAIYINDPDATYTFTVGVGDASITRTIELKKIFPYKVYENFPAGDIDLFYDFSSAIGDEALVRPVRIDSTGKITRWYYLKNRTFTGPDHL